jgi:hypothetical protein
VEPLQSVHGGATASVHTDLGGSVCSIFSDLLQHTSPPWPVVRSLMNAAGIFNPFMRDGAAMIDYLLTGRYTADTTPQHNASDTSRPSNRHCGATPLKAGSSN